MIKEGCGKLLDNCKLFINVTRNTDFDNHIPIENRTDLY